jgi:hypothetical protein
MLAGVYAVTSVLTPLIFHPQHAEARNPIGGDGRKIAMNDHQQWEFTCKICGAHKLTVTRVWHILAGPDSEHWQEWGPLETNHLWHFEFEEKIAKVEDDDEVNRSDYRQDFGKYAKDTSISKLKDYEIYEPRDNPGNDMYFVNCAGCDREIEFGWAKPNRVGGIFPAECSDFIPEEIWPEPRYLKSWHEKHWLKKDTHEVGSEAVE